MKHCYFLLLSALLGSATAHAQQPWQPFRPGLSYQYHEAATPGDTTHVLRLGAGVPVAGAATDSLFRFNGRVGQSSTTVSNCGTRLRLLPDNLFGATLRSQPRAVFTLAAANGRTLALRPRAALGQSWATGLPGLSASVSARTIALVLGLAPDSVVTINFSDGRSLRLSKSYGLLDGPSLDSYLNGRNSRRALALSALPERGLGTALTGFQVIYDFQPGDVFQRVTESYNTGLNALCQKTWRQDSILTRTLSRTGDTLVYTIRTWQVVRGYGSSSAPISFCQSPSTTTYLASVGTWLYSAKQSPSQLTGYYQLSTNALRTLPASSSSRFGGRPEMGADAMGTCYGTNPDSVQLSRAPDWYGFMRYGVGLGATYEHSGSIFNDETTNLVAYRKGNQSWGTLTKPGMLLAARAVQPAVTTTAFPTPFAESLTVAFVLAGPQPVGLALHDALGRVVAAQPAQTLPAGPRQMMLPTAGLPTGLYTLHLHFPAEGRSEVLKVVK